MKTKRAGVKTILAQIDQSADRSSLFYWMVAHHDELVVRAKGRKLRWVELCVTFGTLGLTNRQGEIATEQAARQTWYRVRKEVARQRAYVAAKVATGPSPRSLLPSAVPATWRPTPVIPSPPPASVASPTPGAGPQVSANAAETLARLRRHVNERSGRKPT